VPCKQAKEQNEVVVVSIFVNPTQFLKGEDLDKYPRKDEADKKICELSGVDVLFFPHAKDIYGDDEVSLQAPNVRGYVLEGASRPGHFSGVLTVVMKLLNIVNPTRAYFGKKDAQQLNLINLMVKQLFMSVKIVAVDTVREGDGLAMSSRNVYLSEDEKQKALSISKALKFGAKMSVNEKDCKKIKKEMENILNIDKVQYIAFVDRDFNVITKIQPKNSIILIAGFVGSTRLIDNVFL